jgi:SAM-dependent methyltransferase
MHNVHGNNQVNKSVKLPLSFEEIVAEIVKFTSLTRKEVEHRVWMQAIEPGWNVQRDVEHFRVTPHVYNDNMLQLYREGDGFIFETLVFWAKPFRYQWTQHALNRIQQYAKREGRPVADLRILIFGDGSGNDSLFFANQSMRVDYYDVPGSKTYDFALRRFEYYGCLRRSIQVLPDYTACFQEPYDVVISFEVLEHLPEPEQAIADIASTVKTGGIALVTEDFEDIIDHLPTHLQENIKYAGQMPFIFLKNNMNLTWYNRNLLFKPIEFIKVKQVNISDKLKLIKDPMIRGAALSRYFNKINRLIEKAPYFGG